jgi:NADPH:quinone reductase-like Zn-dependent oxidoreductase
MRAIVYDRYGPADVLRITEVPRPAPKPNEVLVKVHAAAVTRADGETRSANRRSGRVVSGISRLVFGLRRPRQPILGKDFAGEVIGAGPAVTRYDVILDAVGKHSFRRCEPSLKPGGAYLPTDKFENVILALRPRPRDGKRVYFLGPQRVGGQPVELLKELVEAGEFRPVIDRTYAFEDIVEAARYVDTSRRSATSS